MKLEVTFVDYIAQLLSPYANMPEFTICVMKALEKLGHPSPEKCKLEKPIYNKAGYLIQDCED